MKVEITKTPAYVMNHFESYANYNLTFYFASGGCEKLNSSNSYSQHTHNFNKVLEEVYNFPESFVIIEEYKSLYTKDMLTWIEKLRKQCLNDGLKDIGYYSENDNYLVDLNYNIQELKKRNISKISGRNIKN